MKQTKVWLDKSQVETLIKNCQRLKDRCIIQLGCWVGLRSNEIALVEQRDLRQYSVDNELKHFLKIEGKRTKQEKGQQLKKEREAFVPDRVHSDLIMLRNQEKLSGDDPLIPNRFGDKYTPNGIQERVRSVAQNSYESTEDQDFNSLSSHDLRRFFAHYNLVELGKNPRVVMNVGGWESWEAIKPYLDKPSRETVVGELDDLG